VTAAAWLRYPTAMDAALLGMTGPGGSARLDWVIGADGAADRDIEEQPWRTWVDEVVASWAACLLTDPELAERAVAEVTGGEHATGVSAAFRRLLTPDATDRRAAALLRHPDLLAAVTALHRGELLARLGSDEALMA
jgi:hypothetical protein